MALPTVPLDSGNESQHRLLIATTVNELIRTKQDAQLRTEAERTAGVTPTDYAYAPGDVRRYGAVGDGTTDDTSAFRNCLLACSGAPYRMYVPKPTSKYIVDPLTIPDSLTAYFDGGVILEARTGYGASDRLLSFDGASNVFIDFNGAICRMLKAEYLTGEQRHCFYLANCTDVTLRDPVAKDSGGDGFYINGATRLTLHSPTADNNRRNNMSVIKATSLRVTGICRLTNATGTLPTDGLDFEPNSATDELVDIQFETVYSEGNAGNGVTVYLDDYQTGSPSDVSISIGKIISRGNAQGLRVRNCFLNAGSYGGFISVGEVVSEGDSSNALFVQDKSVSGPLLSVGKVTAVNPCTGSVSFADTAAVYLADTGSTVSGGIHIGEVSAKATHTDMDYGVVLEMGGGFTDVRIGLENVRGYQVAPVRYNNITSTIAEATSAIVDTSKLTDTLALTSGTSVVATAHVGRVITNSGALGSITLALREYLPRGNPYRFRVEAAQTITIDTFDATDRIAGTTVAGATVTSNVVGAECDVYYLGTLNTVRMWRLQPLGNPASWTFN